MQTKNKLRNYEIQTRLGSGSYGVIFKALNKTDKQLCVLKQIRMNKMSEKAKKSTLNEATIMGKLIHPFIVQYKESFVQDDTLNIVMEYCDNGDLSMYLKMQNKKPLKQEKIWKFFIQICLGLEYIHKNKILHRDIKTLNIFLNKNQDIKIGDLGVAKMLMANDFAQTIVGTPFYLSPELCEQKPYNQKSDIWALGCLLYELCTYKHPFQAANQASLILKIIRGKYSPIPQFYSKDLKDVIDMCLERDYKRRPTANMILQRAKIQSYIKEFKLEQKINDEYEKIRVGKENKQPQLQKIANQSQKPNNQVIKAENKIPVQNVALIGKKQNQVKKSSVQNQNLKPSLQKKQVSSHAKKPSISGMPEQNIILPDKNNIIQKLKPTNNFVLPKKQVKPQQILKHQQSNNKIKENKDEFLKNLEKAVDNNFNQKKSPLKDKVKESEKGSMFQMYDQKSRLQKIDMKIQEQLIKEQEIQRLKVANERKKAQTPSLISPKPQQKQSLFNDRKSVPALIPKDNSKQAHKQVHRYQSNQVKQGQNPLMPPLPPKNKQQIIKVKMQQPPVQPKVYDSNKSNEQKSKGIIKSRGFVQQIQQDASNIQKSQDRKTDFKRNSVENVAKPVLFGVDEQQMDRKNEANKHHISQKKSPNHNSIKSSQYHSERNIKIISQINQSNSVLGQKKQPEHYIFKKKPVPVSQTNSTQNVNSRIRAKGSSQSNQLSRNAKNASKYMNSEVTKEDQDVVMNLPDSLKPNGDSSDEQVSHSDKKDIKMNKEFALKDINHDAVLQKYQEIINSRSIKTVQSQARSQKKIVEDIQPKMQKVEESSKPKTRVKNLNDENQQFSNQQKVSDSEIDRMFNDPSILLDNNQNEHNEYDLGMIPENESLAMKVYPNEDENDQIEDESEQMIETEEKQFGMDGQQYCSSDIKQQIYEVNNFNLNDQTEEQEGQVQVSSHTQQPHGQTNQSQWSFEQQPQLPMLEDKQSPFFEQANPYLVPQQQQQTIQQKRNYLQIRLEQNMKREDEINKLMQIKIQQCKSVVPKYFDEILEFFRKKINKQDEYTQNDQRQVEDFLRKKGLTDQRKFQNIYKIMHFQMELENTRKIIQRICKKLSELDTFKDADCSI